MADAMTPERLEEIRRYATRTRTVKDLLAERDRLAAENGRLCTKRKAFREGLTLIVKHDGTWKIGFVQHLAKMMLAADDDDTEAQS